MTELDALAVRAYCLDARIALAKLRLSKNDCHKPAGTSEGGQFCGTGGGGGAHIPAVTIDRNFKYEGTDPATKMLNELRQSQIVAVDSYLAGRPIAGEYSDGKWRAVITGGGRKLMFKEGDPTPVPSGTWMDWPEASWGISEAKYKALPRSTRAGMEAKEQVERWIPKEYQQLRQEFYSPKQRQL
jgi:hypothetical protein